MKQIFTTYSTVTEESAAIGDTAERGWYDGGFRYSVNNKPDCGHLCDPDVYDIEEGLTAVDNAVGYLKDSGVTEASSSHFRKGTWYSTETQTEDYSSDEQIQYSFHLEGFTEAEEQEIFDYMTGKK